MTEPKIPSKKGRGGLRINPGGRPARENPAVKRQFNIDKDLSDFLDGVPNKSELINKLLRDFLKKNKLI